MVIRFRAIVGTYLVLEQDGSKAQEHSVVRQYGRFSMTVTKASYALCLSLNATPKQEGENLPLPAHDAHSMTCVVGRDGVEGPSRVPICQPNWGPPRSWADTIQGWLQRVTNLAPR
ncbi:hypothetical protein Cob_v006280 [Colletotrichum orbiculare MAFF 240422]|uniref:Uncharacterized protein n=1 Tax=Colletotrichum orbiculare (strain 104-T / ATCC 96160 / CBS 514.97 / LARS 414 / MAFF 240422) TaxID=1213857 RepID=A0A484FST0_COLOR|nr:hypothetical protein Cob_v006280 [Colletotrichum orbiculare MAFF 240422]